MEDEIKELLGENYHEGMTAKDVQEAFNKMLLNTGKYVNKDNADAQQRKLEKELKEQIEALENDKKTLNESLNSKLTDEEKTKAAEAKRDAELEELRKQLAQSNRDRSELNFTNNVSEAKTLAGIEDDDSDFSNFISTATLEDRDKNDSVSKYINSIVKKAYEKGKSDATKENLGKMGKDGKGSQGDDDGSSEVEQKVKDILSKKAQSKESYYFK